MGLFDRLLERLFESRLFEKKIARENLEEFRKMREARDAVIASGNYSERDGLLVCPHCGHKLSQDEIEENRRRCSGLPAGINPRDFYSCPACDRVLNY